MSAAWTVAVPLATTLARDRYKAARASRTIFAWTCETARCISEAMERSSSVDAMGTRYS